MPSFIVKLYNVLFKLALKHHLQPTANLDETPTTMLPPSSRSTPLSSTSLSASLTSTPPSNALRLPSTYVVGKSRSGIMYRLVVARGNEWWLSEAEDGKYEDDWRWWRAFEAKAVAIGRANHQNVVTLWLYYYASDEKLKERLAKNRTKLVELLRYLSIKSGGEMTSLKDYVTRMKEGQNEFFYIAGENEGVLGEDIDLCNKGGTEA